MPKLNLSQIKSFILKHRFLFLILGSLALIVPLVILAGIQYGGGEYTNLYGCGTAANCNAGPYCDPYTGTCTLPSGYWAVKYTCSGRQTECRPSGCASTSGEQWMQGSAKVDSPHPGNDKTVQIDVFPRNCRVGDCGWECYNSDPNNANKPRVEDYMVWYSGGAAPPPSCEPINGYVDPSTSDINSPVTFIFTSNQGFTNVSIDPGGGAINCGSVIAHSSGNPKDGYKYWYERKCTSVGTSGTYTASFNNAQNCPKQVSYKVFTCEPVSGYADPRPVDINSPVTFIFTSNQGLTNIVIDPGGGAINCGSVVVHSSGNPKNSDKYWWERKCTSVGTAGSYTASFDNDQNCKKQVSYTVSTGCQFIHIYREPRPVPINEQITFTFTSNQHYTNVNINTGGGASNCNLTNSSCSGNPMGDGYSCWWRWNCTASTTGGTYTATFNNAQNCPKTTSYTVSSPPPSCIPIKSYAQPGIVLFNSSIKFTFTSNANYTGVTLNPAAGARNCSLTNTGCNDMPGANPIPGDTNRCWWVWNCISSDAAGVYDAVFNNAENCPESARYIVEAPSCPHNSTQVRVHKQDADPWADMLTLLPGEKFIAGIFRDGMSAYTYGARLRIFGSDYSGSFDNGNLLEDRYSNLALFNEGWYTIRGEMIGYEYLVGCWDIIQIRVVAPPDPPPTVDIKANDSNGPITIDYNTQALLSWTSTNADSCTASASPAKSNWTGPKEINGTQWTGNLTQSTVYTITCAGSGGSAQDSVTVNVRPPVGPTVDIKANDSDGPITIDYNTQALLSWTSTNADSCKASASPAKSNWTGAKEINGTQWTGNLTQSTVYTIECTGIGGFASDSVTVNVGEPILPPMVDIKANGSDGPVIIDNNTAALLTWTSTNTTSCTASASPSKSNWTGAKALSGSQTTGNLTQSTWYFINCLGPGGSAEDSVLVSVKSPGIPSVDIKARPFPSAEPFSDGPITIQENTSAELQWVSENVHDCIGVGHWSGNKNTSGTAVVGPLSDPWPASEYVYIITCERDDGLGPMSDEVRVQIIKLPTLFVGLITMRKKDGGFDEGVTVFNVGEPVYLKAVVSGTATGLIRYSFDCNFVKGVPVTWEYDYRNEANEILIVNNACPDIYSNAGTYRVRVRAIREGLVARDAETINIVDTGNNCPVPDFYCSEVSGIPNDCEIYATDRLVFVNNSTDADGENDILNSRWDVIGWGDMPDLTCSGKCNYTRPMTLGVGSYAMKLYIEDRAGCIRDTTKNFIIKGEAEAGFMCSLDNLNFQICETLVAEIGDTVYLKDDPALFEHSMPSEGATIIFRAWQKNGVLFSGPMTNETNPSLVLQDYTTDITLTIVDTATKTASRTHTITIALPPPEWIEVNP